MAGLNSIGVDIDYVNRLPKRFRRSEDYFMPQAYIDEIVKQTLPKKKINPCPSLLQDDEDDAAEYDFYEESLDRRDVIFGRDELGREYELWTDKVY